VKNPKKKPIVNPNFKIKTVMVTLLLIDSNGLMHRAYHALPLLTSQNGQPTNIIYGFFSMLYRTINELKPDYLAAVFDTPKPTFRNKLFADYQIQRPKIEDSFAVQIPLLKEGLDIGGIKRLEKDGFEADDIIGTLSTNFSSKDNLKIVIFSSDKDILQLIKPNVSVIAPKTGISDFILYQKEEVIKKLNIAPEQIVDYKALAGDPSDNYPGAKGIGPKTAVQLINQFGTIDQIYKNIDQIKSKRLKEILLKGKESVFLSKKLAQILTNVDIKVNLEELKFTGFNDQLKNFFETYQIYSLVKRVFNNQKEKLIKKKATDNQDNQISLF